MWIDGWAVPAAGHHPLTAQAWIDHALSASAAARAWQASRLPAPEQAAARLLPASVRTDHLAALDPALVKRYQLSAVTPAGLQKRADIWERVSGGLSATGRGYTRRPCSSSRSTSRWSCATSPRRGCGRSSPSTTPRSARPWAASACGATTPIEAALTDVLRLSRGMTYKNAAAGLDLGGGKTVVLGDPRTQKTDLMFRALGRFVDSLGGRYLAAEDVGTEHRRRRARGARDRPHHRPADRARRLRRPVADDRLGRLLRHPRRPGRGRASATTWTASGWRCRAPATSAAASCGTCWMRARG